MSKVLFKVGAARAYAESLYGGPVAEFLTNVPVAAISTVASVIAPFNGDRVSLVFFNGSTTDMNLSVNQSNVVSGNGILLPAKTGFLSLNLHDDLTLVSAAWFAVGAIGAQTIQVYEVIRISQQLLQEVPAQG